MDEDNILIGYILPVTDNLNQEFSTTLPINGRNVKLKFTLRYNHIAEYWFMSVSDASTNQMFLDSIPLIESDGAASDIIFQYAYLDIGSAFVLRLGQIDNKVDRPNAVNLSTMYQLVWSDTI